MAGPSPCPWPRFRPCFRPRQLEPDLHWRWVSSTALLCYGQMAMHAGKQVLPWVDNIASRMVYYFTCSSHVSPAGLWAAGGVSVCARACIVCACA